MQSWSENVFLVELPSEPKTSEAVKTVVRHVRDRGDCDVVLDFSDVTILTSTSLASLLRLRKLLDSCGQRLVLCCVDHATKGIFSVTGLDDAFEFVNDRHDALATVEALPDGPTVSGA